MNPPAAPVGCETCGAVAGARCMTGLGHVAQVIHAARARQVARWHEQTGRAKVASVVVVLDDWRRLRNERRAHAR